jgi:hypothetical protein
MTLTRIKVIANQVIKRSLTTSDQTSVLLIDADDVQVEFDQVRIGSSFTVVDKVRFQEYRISRFDKFEEARQIR